MKITGLDGYGIEIVDREPIEMTCNEKNMAYMYTKYRKMGHLLHFTPDKTDKLLELLNAWTDSVNSLLPQPEFLNWQKADNPPAILIFGQ